MPGRSPAILGRRLVKKIPSVLTSQADEIAGQFIAVNHISQTLKNDGGLQSGSARPDSSVSDIPRRRNLSYEEFVREYLYQLRPVVIEDAASQWNAVKRWSPGFFKSEFGNRQITVHDVKMKISYFVDRVVHATEDNPAPYLLGTGQGNYFKDLFPELAADIVPIPEYISPNWLGDRYLISFLGQRLNRGPRAEIFFGGKGSSFPVMHWDSLGFHAFNVQVYGEKTWYLYEPQQSSCVYPKHPGSNQSQISDVVNPDLTRFPLFAKAVRHQNTLKPGEMIFVPAGWWHTTRIPCPSISIAINSANGSNWPAVSSELVKRAKDKSLMLAMPMHVYLKLIRRRKCCRDRRNGVGY